MRTAILVLTGLIGLGWIGSLPAARAASFACAKASTPFEHAICDNPELSARDSVLATAFATAIGGLSAAARADMLADQRDWLGFARSGCFDDVQELTHGRYDAAQTDCVLALFNRRIATLEQSRMRDGVRFYLHSVYGALPDRAQQEAGASYGRIAHFDASIPLMDADSAEAAQFNKFVAKLGAKASPLLARDGDVAAMDAKSDVSVRISVSDVSESRISLQELDYWFGHGAAHGNAGFSHIHYLPKLNREMVASDIFAGNEWQENLAALAMAALQTRLGDGLFVTEPAEIMDAVIDPQRWEFTDAGLSIQFQQYEVTAYANGAPKITIGWDRIYEFQAEGANQLLY